MRSKPATKARRNKRWIPQQKLHAQLQIINDDIFDDLSTKEPTYPEHNINSGLHKEESTLTKELRISANDIPVPRGGFVHDYDGLEMSISRLNSTFVNVRNRLDWAGTIIRSQEIALWEKDCALALLQGHDSPKKPPPIPYFEPHTDPGTVVMISKPIVNRALMGLIGVVSGAFFLYCVGVLLFE